MSGNEVARAYREISARGATPLGMVILLYDTILADFRRALAALEAKDTANRISEMNHALAVIAELQNVLDFDRGGGPARRLDRFYNVTRGLVLEANIRASRQAILQLVDLYSSLRQAWSQAEQQTAAELAAPALEAVPVAVAAGAGQMSAATASSVDPDELEHDTWSA
jgi:flagellar protein FliS